MESNKRKTLASFYQEVNQEIIAKSIADNGVELHQLIQEAKTTDESALNEAYIESVAKDRFQAYQLSLKDREIESLLKSQNRLFNIEMDLRQEVESLKQEMENIKAEQANLVGLLETLNFKIVSALDGKGKETWFRQDQWIIITTNPGSTSYEYHDGFGFLSSNLSEIITLLHKKFKNEIRDYQISTLINNKI